MDPTKSESEQQERNWLELPSDVSINILNRVGMIDILENVQKVCTAWRKICLDPAMWRVINMNDLYKWKPNDELLIKKMCKNAVDRSQGQLVDITLVHPYNIKELLPYVAERSRQLRRLEMLCHHGAIQRGFTNVLMKLPLLEELSLYSLNISEEEIETVSRYCPMLKTLKVNREASSLFFWEIPFNFETLCNETAVAIGENLHGLRHLELIGNNMTNIGLQAILDGCRDLETLDLRNYLYIDLEEDLGTRCSNQIKNLKLPNDPLEDYPSIYEEEDVTDYDNCGSADCYYDSLYDG